MQLSSYCFCKYNNWFCKMFNYTKEKGEFFSRTGGFFFTMLNFPIFARDKKAQIDMFTVISIFFCGIALGYLLKDVRALQHLGKSVFYTILALLFILGLSIGSNETIVENIALLGSQALLVAVATTLGSLCAAKLVYRCFFRKGKES